MKKCNWRILFILLLLALFPISTQVSASVASTDLIEKNYITSFSDQLAAEVSEYSCWSGQEPLKAYDIYDLDQTTIFGTLYYIGSSDNGYVIIDKNSRIIEFSLGKCAYDNYTGTFNIAMYHNGCYYIDYGNVNIRLFSDGTIESTESMHSRVAINMDVHKIPSGKYCIPTAIANILWFWDSNGFSNLVASNFTTLVDDITSIMGSGCTSNSYIQSAVVIYATSKNYSGTVTSLSATKNSVMTEINSNRPCLLGFSSASSYGAAHMTACCGYYTVMGEFYTSVVDGHSSTVVNKAWGNYNDFVARIIISQ